VRLKKLIKSEVGRKPLNRLMMFKILLLQTLYKLSDAQTEYQIKDCLSFSRFLKLELGDTVPDEKTIWLFREQLSETKTLACLFKRFDKYLAEQGILAELGHIVDASLIEVPKQRNSREENAQIKQGKIPESFTRNPSQWRQKDVEARWAVKGGKTSYGYKNHINIDAKNKIIRAYCVTTASAGDKSQVEKLLHAVSENDKRVWGEGAYFSAEQEVRLQQEGFISRIINRTKNFPEHSAIARENHRRSKIRQRVEHVFGFIQNSMRGKFIRTIGLARATVKVGLMNFMYNLRRYEQLTRIVAS